MTASSEPIAITVVGDVIVDRHFYHSDDGVVEVAELGGAGALRRLLHEVIQAANASSRVAVTLGMDKPSTGDLPLARNAYAVWAPCRQSSDDVGRKFRSLYGQSQFGHQDVDRVSTLIRVG
jgi:hypothetical protein